jgi:cytochrome c peroxidase
MAIPAYQQQFEAVYPAIADGAPIGFTDISNAIAAFVAFEWRTDQSLFDAHLRGERPLTGAAERGMNLFYGSTGCAQCHSGPLLSDMDFHPMGQPQLGPGKAARFESHQLDVGRMRVTGRAADAYAFRTPPLRNVVHTGPWGHAGAFSDLAAFLRHHINPSAGLADYQPQATLPALAEDSADWAVMDDPGARAEIAAAAMVAPTVVLSDPELSDLLAFLNALTDPVALAGRLGVPDAVPSGLAIDR